MRDLRLLPKAHLHLHLDGAMRPATLAELSQRQWLTVPENRGYGSFDHFMATIQAVQAVLRTPDEVERLVREVLDDAANDGAVWVELSMWPGMLRQLGGFTEVTELVLNAGRRAAQETGVGLGLMLAANRGQGPAEALEVADVAVSLRDRGVVAFGLDGDESDFTTRDFALAFDRAKAAGLLCTPHVGELTGAERVAEAIDLLHADRVLHGISSTRSPELVKRLADSGICLDLCLTSNVLLSAVPTLAEHPLASLLRQGVRCSVNADDPGLFGSSLLQEYELCRSVFGLSDREIATIAGSSIASSGAPEAWKRAAAAGIEASLAYIPDS